MRRFLTTLFALLIATSAYAQTVYFQGGQQPGVLSAPSPGGVPYVASGGNAAVAPTSSCRINATGGSPALSAASSYTAQTPAAGTTFYWAEVYVPAPCLATGVAVFNSATISGNVKVALANSAGIIQASSAGTAMAGTTAYQLVPFSATFNVTPGTWYIGVLYDNNTVRPNTYTSGNFVTGSASTASFTAGIGNFTPGTTFTTGIGPVASLY